MEPGHGACPCGSCWCGKGHQSAPAITWTILDNMTTAWKNFEAQAKTVLMHQKWAESRTRNPANASQTPCTEKTGATSTTINLGATIIEDSENFNGSELHRTLSRLPPETTTKPVFGGPTALSHPKIIEASFLHWLNPNPDTFNHGTQLVPMDLSVAKGLRIPDELEKVSLEACRLATSKFKPSTSVGFKRSFRPSAKRKRSQYSESDFSLSLQGLEDNESSTKKESDHDDAPANGESIFEQNDEAEQDRTSLFTTGRNRNVFSTTLPSTRPHPGKNFRCTDCFEICESAEAFDLHLKTHNSTHPYKCGFCATRFETIKLRSAHVKIHQDDAGYFKCDHCQKSFSNSTHFVEHVRIHTGERPYQCDQCDRRFARHSDMVRHKKRHLLGISSKCDSCAVTFSSAAKFNRHSCKRSSKKLHGQGNPDQLTSKELEPGKVKIQPHVGQKQLKCTFCSKIFLEFGEYKEHLKNHYSEKNPYKCSQCPKSFSQSNYLKGHQRSHSHAGGKSFQCDQCSKVFAKKSTLQQHKRNHHFITNPDAINPNNSHLWIGDSTSNSSMRLIRSTNRGPSSEVPPSVPLKKQPNVPVPGLPNAENPVNNMEGNESTDKPQQEEDWFGDGAAGFGSGMHGSNDQQVMALLNEVDKAAPEFPCGRSAIGWLLSDEFSAIGSDIEAILR